jgi:ribosomal 50S subunit-associated protein YjgA (DUF615 family)
MREWLSRTGRKIMASPEIEPQTQLQSEEHDQTTWNVLVAECQKKADELSYLAEEIAKIPNTVHNKLPISGDVRVGYLNNATVKML